MTLEEKLRAYAAKGELVHLSLSYSNSGGAFEFHASFAAATPAAGYSTGRSADPVEAIEKALKAAPIKPPRVSTPRVQQMAEGEEGGRLEKKGGLRTDWTTP